MKTLREEDVAESIICGPDPAPYIERISKFADAGYDYVCFHQVGADQEGFFNFFERTLVPEFS